jgi:hypothetical protein
MGIPQVYLYPNMAGWQPNAKLPGTANGRAPT